VPDLDLTCALELHTQSCDKDDVAVVDGANINLESTQHVAVVACVSTGSSQCVTQPSNGVFSHPDEHSGGRIVDTYVFLEQFRGSNRARLSADSTPRKGPFDTMQIVNPAMMQIEMVGGFGSGMVHYNRPVAHYFASIPLCSSRAGWQVFVTLRTFSRLRAISPCRTRQNGRQNFVYFHPAELGLQFSVSTILAFFKTPNAQNRIADMRRASNLQMVDIITDTSVFTLHPITEMRRTPNSQLQSATTNDFTQHLQVGDVFVYSPPPLTTNGLNISILAPDHLLGSVDANYIIQYPTTSILLSFPGVYTIVEDSMTLRRGGKMLPTRTKHYLRVLKRTVPVSESTEPTIDNVPLQYVSLIDVIKQDDIVPIFSTPSLATVVNGITDDQMLATLYNNGTMIACDRSLDWDPYDTDLSRSTTFIDSLLPCSLTHQTSVGIYRKITYF